jgi:nucleoside-diphosphate-sugar epimerase
MTQTSHKKTILKAEELAFPLIKKQTIGITGATGLLGRNLLFEIFKQYAKNLNSISIIIFGRPNNKESLHTRITDILKYDGCHYLGVSADSDFLKHVISRIQCVEQDLLDFRTNNPPTFLKRYNFDFFYHLAAVSDFKKTLDVQNKLLEINVRSTQAILNTIQKFSVDQFIYTGTAFSCGSNFGNILPTFGGKPGQFRNHYEETKLLAEEAVIHNATQNDINYKIFRPVAICGRAMEPTIGQTNKFDLFYAWAAFFLKMKLKIFGNMLDALQNSVRLDLRIACGEKSTLNVVPVDYAAKLIWTLSNHSPTNNSYHICNDFEVPNRILLQIILDRLKITGVRFTETIPREHTFNTLERIYYRSIGNIYTDYLTMPPTHFSQDNIMDIKHQFKLEGIPFDLELVSQLLQFAINNGFGILKTPMTPKTISEFNFQ